MRDASDRTERNGRRAIQALALITVLLALMCLALAVAWRREHQSAACWRAQAQDGDYAQGPPCR